MNGLVTVIVPVYKTSKFLKKSILSIVHQTYKNLEIILIDDGSPDSCPKICDSLSKKDSRIRVLHQKNSGVSRARNAGISISNGEYICFVDSDDWLPNESIERLVLNMEKNHSDFCYGGIEEIGTINTNYRGVSQEAVCDVEDSKQLISFLKHLKTVAGPWGKMYRRDIIKQNSIIFPEDIAYAEDRIFLWNYIQHCSRISSFPQNVYFYSKLNANNACSKYYPKYNLWMKTTIDMYSQIFKSFDKETESEINRSAFKLLNDSIIRYSLAEIDEATSINYIEKTISLFQTYISKMKLDDMGEYAELYEVYKVDLRNQNYHALYNHIQKKYYTKPKSIFQKIIRAAAVDIECFLIFTINMIYHV